MRFWRSLGSVRQLTDSTGAVTLARTYDPGACPECNEWGVVTSATGPSASGYGFTGEYQSADLVYLRARHYAPGTGRFLTRDTWGGEANRPLSFNRWGYVEGNPVNLTDPTGNFPCGPECIDSAGEKIRKIILAAIKADFIFGNCISGMEYGIEYVGLFNLSGYYTPLESDSTWTGGKIPIPADPNSYKWGHYLTTDGKYNDNVVFAQTAKSDFLNDMQSSVCMQGSGKLIDGRIIHCSRKYPVFEWGSKETSIARVKAFDTVAICKNSSLRQNDEIYIDAPWFETFMSGYDHDVILNVVDTGGGLCKTPYSSIDVYLGEGSTAYSAWWDDFMIQDSTNEGRGNIYWPVYRITKNKHFLKNRPQ
jgi:RHS repeat-associated protein